MGKILNMNLLISFLLPLGALLLSNTSLGQEKNVILDKYKEAIQNYIMTGHDKGWKQCDNLSDGISYEGAPHISMEWDKIKTLDTKFAFAFSNCLLVTYHVDSKASLSSLLDFGWSNIKHLRLALVIKLGAGMTLDMTDMTTNFTKLPFLVAAESYNGQTQFLCPVIGENEPRLELDMCKPSYVSYRNRTLRAGIMGIKPYAVITKFGYDGINYRLLSMLAERLNFKSKVIAAPSIIGSINMVCYFH